MLAVLRRRIRCLASRWRRDRSVDDGAAGATDQAELVELRARHESVRQEAHAEVGGVLRETEAATLSIGGSLDRAVQASQSFIQDIKQRLGGLEDEDGRGVSATLDRQSQLVMGFLSELTEMTRRQREASERMIETSNKVAEAAESVAKISVASRVLCLNTMIEAGRLGDVGQPMIVIADQMRTLSDQIGTFNDEISASMAALLPTLEEVGSSTAQADERAAQFSSEFSLQSREVDEVAGCLRETTHTALAAGDQQLDLILANSRSALESLQTQDLVSQRLRRVLQLLDKSGDRLDEASHGTPATGECDKPDVYLSEQIGEDERELEAGDMMMF